MLAPKENTYHRDFINHQSAGPQPVIFEQDQLISFLAGPPNQLIFMFKANRWYIKPAQVLKGPVKQHLCWSCGPVVVQSLIKPLISLKPMITNTTNIPKITKVTNNKQNQSKIIRFYPIVDQGIRFYTWALNNMGCIYLLEWTGMDI